MALKFILVSIITLSIHSTTFSQTFNDIINKAEEKADKVKEKTEQVIDKYTGQNKAQLSNEDIINGLKEALSVGTNSAVSISSKADGFLKNPKIFIPWPAEAQEMKDKLIKFGFEKKVTEFETSLNRAAEDAAKDATPIFLNAIKKMTIQDGMGILKGADTAATHYLKQSTYDSLYTKFFPIVKNSIQKVKVTSYWKPLVTTYNKLPNKKKHNPDLEKYVTQKAIYGLFTLVADEEKNIRKNPAARVSDLLKKVFGVEK